MNIKKIISAILIICFSAKAEIQPKPEENIDSKKHNDLKI